MQYTCDRTRRQKDMQYHQTTYMSAESVTSDYLCFRKLCGDLMESIEDEFKGPGSNR